jgi:hypothetical protein
MTYVLDSSLYTSEDSVQKQKERDFGVNVGTIKEIKYLSTPPYSLYLVEIFISIGTATYVWCEPTFKFGSPTNYEQFIHSASGGSNSTSSTIKSGDYKCGSKVLIVRHEGSQTGGFIIGGLCHNKMPAQLTYDDGVVYVSEFNGVETIINSAGEYTLTFKGTPTNIDKINLPPTRLEPIPDATYNKTIAGSKFKFYYDGSIELDDNNQQKVFIDKTKGTITIHSGNNFIIFNKEQKSISTSAKDVIINGSGSIQSSTESYLVSANQNYLVKSPKIALGTPEIELLDQITKLVDKIGECTVISPVGPCTPISASSQWGGVSEIKGKIEQIKGALS